MIEQIKYVEEFHNAFGIVNEIEPTVNTLQNMELRYKLLEEELIEYKEAVENNDIVEIADALGDQLYIVFGTILKHGLQHIITDVFNEIQRSNMSKLDENGKAIINGQGIFDETKPLGKILKSELYTEPDIAKILNK